MWVKEGCWYRGKHRIGSNGSYDGSAEGEAVSGSMTINRGNVAEASMGNRSVNGYTDNIDPVVSDMVCRLKSKDEHAWYDPIVVNETAGWLMVMSDGDRKSYPQPHEGLVNLSENIPTLSSQPKNP